jgi:hypothetical protein
MPSPGMIPRVEATEKLPFNKKTAHRVDGRRRTPETGVR